MSERPEASPANATAEQPNAAPVDATDETLAAASQAAAEHMVNDAENAGHNELDELNAQLASAKAELAEMKDRWLRLNAEFDNFRKRTAKEKLEMLQFAGENSLKNMLPVVDDMERAIANNANTTEIAAVKEGFQLIHHKLLHILGSQGVKPMENVKGHPFDVDRHEAITKAPAPSDDLKGKVIDVVESGYTLHDKVIRYAKVVVGE
ncbi:MAG: nucleotide exchange factor GrpE [Flavobacteriales bacterium]